MSEHVSDGLPRLLTGDATRDEAQAAAAHLRSCADCQQELVAAVAAHAALASAHRFAPLVVAGTDEPDPEPAGRHAADGATASDEALDVADGAESTDRSAAANLPDMSSVFAQIRAEAAERPVNPPASRVPRRHRTLLVAAAAVVLVGAGAGTYAAISSGSNGPGGRKVALDAFETGRSPATVTIVGNGRMAIDASSLPHLDAQHQYEVWLTNGARTQMRSVGFIGADNRATLPVSPSIMSRYSDIEVSVQRSDETDYSGTSVLRGDYR